MNKFKNKRDLKKIILKLKLKLDSSDENSVNDDSSQIKESQSLAEKQIDPNVVHSSQVPNLITI